MAIEATIVEVQQELAVQSKEELLLENKQKGNSIKADMNQLVKQKAAVLLRINSGQQHFIPVETTDTEQPAEDYTPTEEELAAFDESQPTETENQPETPTVTQDGESE